MLFYFLWPFCSFSDLRNKIGLWQVNYWAISVCVLPSWYHFLSVPRRPLDVPCHRRGWRSIVKKMEGKGSPQRERDGGDGVSWAMSLWWGWGRQWKDGDGWSILVLPGKPSLFSHLSLLLSTQVAMSASPQKRKNLLTPNLLSYECLPSLPLHSLATS